MTKQRNSQMPAFKGYSFKPIEPEREDEMSGAATDPLLQPEEQGTIKRYLRYADTLINSPALNDDTPADNQSVREVSLLGARRSTDRDLPDNADPGKDNTDIDTDKEKKAA
jgi:hypothetical protein